jgi:hypothetical protein
LDIGRWPFWLLSIGCLLYIVYWLLSIEERLEFSSGHTLVSLVLRKGLRVVAKTKTPKMPILSTDYKFHFPLAVCFFYPPNPHALWNF